jgi:hypothetical protein
VAGVAAMIDFLTSQGWTVEIKPGRVYLSKGGIVADYPTLLDAYRDRGGPLTTFQAPMEGG